MIRRVIDLNEINVTQLERLGKDFISATNLNASFCLGHFTHFWSTAMRMGVAALFEAKNDSGTYGLIGLLLSQCPFSGEVTAIETFWYVDILHREGLTGPKLFKAAIDWAKEVGAKRITFSSIVQNTAGKLEAFYEKAGFTKLESYYVKEL
jgi:GNAT superfamily N-acetyltransferase